MTIRAYQNIMPNVHKTAYVDESSVVIGKVEIGENSSIWPLVVARGDVHEIKIGQRSNIQDGSVLHVTHAGPYDPEGYPLIIGDQVTVGHKAMLHGCTIENECLIGMGSVVMDGAIIRSQVIVGANSLVPPGRELESGYLWVGSPARKIRPLTEEEKKFFAYSADNYVKVKDNYMNG